MTRLPADGLWDVSVRRLWRRRHQRPLPIFLDSTLGGHCDETESPPEAPPVESSSPWPRLEAGIVEHRIGAAGCLLESLGRFVNALDSPANVPIVQTVKETL